MTFDEAMHARCSLCGGEAQMHRMSDSGNFYCLEPNKPSLGGSWRSTVVRSWNQHERLQWAMSRAKLNELRRSPIPKEVGQVIAANLRGSVEAFRA